MCFVGKHCCTEFAKEIERRGQGFLLTYFRLLFICFKLVIIINFLKKKKCKMIEVTKKIDHESKMKLKSTLLKIVRCIR